MVIPLGAAAGAAARGAGKAAAKGAGKAAAKGAGKAAAKGAAKGAVGKGTNYIKQASELLGLEGKSAQKSAESAQLSQRLNQLAKEHLKLIGEEAKGLRSIADIKKEIVKLQEILAGTKGKDSKLAQRILQDKIKELGITKQESKFQKENSKFLGISGNLMKMINKWSGGFFNNTKEVGGELQKNMTNMLKSNKNASLWTKSLKAAKLVMGSIGKLLKGILSNWKELKAMGFSYSTEIKNIRNELGLSYGQAHLLRTEFTEAAAMSGKMHINSQRLQKTYGELIKNLGVGSTSLIGAHREATVEATNMRIALGLSEKSVAGLTQMYLVGNKSMKQQKLDMIGAVKAVESEYGTRLNMRQVMEETGNLTGQMRAQLEASPEAIARAVSVAKELGMTMEDINKSTSSLLNFHSSIEAELEAELLLGRELNLERARAAALAGDYETLAKEIGAQVGSWNDFTKLNVLQQKALANAVGLTADQLSDQLLKKENLRQLAEEARAMGNEDLAKQLEARAAAEKINDAWQKFKGIIIDLLGGPMAGILDLFGSLLSILNPIAQVVGYIFGSMAKFAALDFENMTFLQKIVGAIGVGILLWHTRAVLFWGVQKAINILGWAYNTMMGIRIGLQTASNAKESVGFFRKAGNFIVSMFDAGADAPPPTNLVLPFVYGAIAGAIVGGIIAAYLMSSGTADDFYADGYGKKGYWDEGGITALNNNDYLIAGTGLGKLDGASTINSAPQFDEVNMGTFPVEEMVTGIATAIGDVNYVATDDVFLRRKRGIGSHNEAMNLAVSKFQA
tara:strand:- start:5025 stop:7403 length:2379 start_codon:yes stop_codon:yes gene_type:complete